MPRMDSRLKPPTHHHQLPPTEYHDRNFPRAVVDQGGWYSPALSSIPAPQFGREIRRKVPEVRGLGTDKKTSPGWGHKEGRPSLRGESDPLRPSPRVFISSKKSVKNYFRGALTRAARRHKVRPEATQCVFRASERSCYKAIKKSAGRSLENICSGRSG